MFEKQLQQIDGTLTTLEYQRESLENASTTSVILNTLSYAAKASKEAFNNLNIDDVNNLQDDLAEQRGKD
jgi:charged multivesicular body protein 4